VGSSAARKALGEGKEEYEKGVKGLRPVQTEQSRPGREACLAERKKIRMRKGEGNWGRQLSSAELCWGEKRPRGVFCRLKPGSARRRFG